MPRLTVVFAALRSNPTVWHELRQPSGGAVGAFGAKELADNLVFGLPAGQVTSLDAVQVAAVRATALLADIRKERRRSLIGANSDEANRESLVSTDEMKMIKAFTGLRVGGRARGRGGRGRHGRGRGSGSF